MDNTFRIVITGANGFIGSKLVKSLSGEKKNIFCLDRNIHSLFDISSLKALLTDADIIYHFAGATAGSGHNPGKDVLTKNNIEATYNLLNAITQFCKKPPLLVNMSTIHVYDKTVSELSESSNLSPSNVYGITKLTQEFLIRQATQVGIIRSVIFRASNVYGEGDRPNHNSAIATFCDKIKRNMEVTLFARGEATLDLIYVDDVVDVLKNIEVFEKHNGQTYNLATGVTVSINEVINNLKKISGLDIKTKLVDGTKHEFSIKIDKLRKAYPEIKHHNINDGLKKTYGNKA